MRTLFTAISLAALLVIAGASMGAANGAIDGELRVVALATQISPDGGSILLKKGETLYVEWDVFTEGNPGVPGAKIGEANAMLMAIGDVGVRGGMGLWVYDIDGKGQIHVSVEPFTATGEVFFGAILGGTGIFRSAKGEYHHFSPIGSGELHLTFKFQPSAVGGTTSFLVDGSGSSAVGWVILASIGAAGVSVLIGGGWYTRKRWMSTRT